MPGQPENLAPITVKAGRSPACGHVGSKPGTKQKLMAGVVPAGSKKLSLDPVVFLRILGHSNLAMGISRTILAVIIAFSVAFLPIAGSAAHSLQPTEVMDMSGSADMSISKHTSVSEYMSVFQPMPVFQHMSVSQRIPDCCPPEATPCDKAKSMAPCASVCCSFLVPALSALNFPLILAETMPTLLGQVFRSQSSSPPFRPPCV